MAGVLLAESEYRHQIEADILPFRGLLLGLFFMSVGMSLDPGPLLTNAGVILGSTLALLAVKAALVICLSLLVRAPLAVAVRTGFILSQAGEFGFVLFSLANGLGIISAPLMDNLVAVIVLSMALTPLMAWLGNKLAERIKPVIPGELDDVDVHETRPVLIAGFGRVGETVANMLEAADVPYIAIDADVDRVIRARRLGYRVFFGSA